MSLLFLMGGIMRGVITAAQLLALIKEGYKFDIIVGNSIGAVIAAYCMCGMGSFVRGLKLYIDESPKHIFVWKVWKVFLGCPIKIFRIADMETIYGLMDKGRYALDGCRLSQNLSKSNTKFFVGVTDENGCYKLLDFQQYGIAAIKASMSLYGKLNVGGKWYGDGGRYQLPIKQVLKQFPGVTHVLILANVPENEKTKISFSQRWNGFLEFIVPWKSSPAAKNAIREALRENALPSLPLINGGRYVGILYAPVKVGSFERNSKVLMAAFRVSYMETMKLLKQYEAGCPDIQPSFYIWPVSHLFQNKKMIAVKNN